MRITFHNSLLFLFLILFSTHSVLIAGKREKILPLPMPPDHREQVQSADIILYGTLVKSRSYKIGKYFMAQSVILCKTPLKLSDFFTISPGKEFTVTYRLTPNEWGPEFREPLESGEYIFFINLRNVDIRGKIVGMVPEFFFPNRFSLSPGEDRIAEIQGLLRK